MTKKNGPIAILGQQLTQLKVSTVIIIHSHLQLNVRRGVMKT